MSREPEGREKPEPMILVSRGGERRKPPTQQGYTRSDIGRGGELAQIITALCAVGIFGLLVIDLIFR